MDSNHTSKHDTPVPIHDHSKMAKKELEAYLSKHDLEQQQI